MINSSFTVDKEITAAWPAIRKHPVFEGLADTEVKAVLPFFRYAALEDKQRLLEEGQETIDLYLILSGKLDVIRKTDPVPDASSHWFVDQEFRIAALAAGDAIGEFGFAGRGNRSASVHCLQRAELLALSPGNFDLLEDEYPKISSRMMKNLLGATGAKLKKTTDNEVGALKMELQNSMIRSKANLFFSYVIGLLCVYNLAIHQMTVLSSDTNRASILSVVIIVIFCAALLIMIRQSQLPLHFFGLTTRNWRPVLQESLVWTGVIVAALILIKWLLILSVPRYHHLPVFSFDPVHTKYLAFNFALYGLHSPVQEFIARGVLQGSLQNFFKGKNVTFRAILISNAIFSATHVHMLGGLLGVVVFLPGLFWGWLYSRHENLIGVCVSHLLIGWTAFFFLDLESLF